MAKKKRRKTLLCIARSARETSRNGSADPANLPRKIRMRKLRAKNKILVPLKPQQKTTTPSTNTRTVMSYTGKTNAKTPVSRNKKHRGRSFIEERRRIIVVGLVSFWRQRWWWWWQDWCQRQHLLWQRRRLWRQQRIWRRRRRRLCIIDAQSILVDKIEKTQSWEKVKIKLHSRDIK